MYYYIEILSKVRVQVDKIKESIKKRFYEFEGSYNIFAWGSGK